MTYLAFFHLKEADSIAEQLQIFLSTLASHLGSDQFSVQGSVVVLLVRREVHLIVVHVGRSLSGLLLGAWLWLRVLDELLSVFTVSNLVSHFGTNEG